MSSFYEQVQEFNKAWAEFSDAVKAKLPQLIKVVSIIWVVLIFILLFSSCNAIDPELQARQAAFKAKQEEVAAARAVNDSLKEVQRELLWTNYEKSQEVIGKQDAIIKQYEQQVALLKNLANLWERHLKIRTVEAEILQTRYQMRTAECSGDMQMFERLRVKETDLLTKLKALPR